MDKNTEAKLLLPEDTRAHHDTTNAFADRPGHGQLVTAEARRFWMELDRTAAVASPMCGRTQPCLTATMDMFSRRMGMSSARRPSARATADP
jgi:hypothetical protein